MRTAKFTAQNKYPMPPSNLSRRKPAGLGADHLWPLIILAGFLFYVSLVPLPPNDFWWHLKVGEFIAQNQAVPTTNMYGWTLPPGQPFFYAAWLGEWLMYVGYRIGGVDLLTCIRTILAGITFWLVGAEAQRRSGSWRIAAFALALAALMSMSVPLVRTQMWAWLPFILFSVLLSRFAAGRLSPRWLLLLPLLMAFWVNVHGSFILGLILAGAYLAGETLRKLLKQPGAPTWRSIAWLGAAGLLTILATLVNPRGLEIFGYVRSLLANSPIQQLVTEWQPPTPHGVANITFYASILVWLAVQAYSHFRPSPTDMLLTLGFLWLAWSGQRSLMWFGIVAMPVLAQSLSALPIKGFGGPTPRSWLNGLVAVLLFAPVLLVQPWLVESFPLPETYWQQVLRRSPQGALLSTETPIAAAAYLQAHPGGKLFQEMGYASYLIWAVPGQGVFVDPRIELYPNEQWQDYLYISQGIQYNVLLSQYGANRILLSRATQKGLANELPDDPCWQLEYQDENAQLWIKNDPPPAGCP